MIEFANAIRSSGLEPPLNIVPGRVMRFPGIGKGRGNTAAWCKLFEDCKGGIFGDYSSGMDFQVWQMHNTKPYTPDERAAFARNMAASRAKHDKERAINALAAASKAAAIIAASKMEKHSYLDTKGWPDETGLTYYPKPGKNLLIIPMRASNNLVGCQMIDRDGAKLFLKGQRTSGAEFVFGSRGTDIYCEGWATGRSIIECMPGTRVHCTFSAGNLQRMATKGFVVADNDISGVGEAAAMATGLPYFMPAEVGTDFNDLHRQYGTFKTSMLLQKWLTSSRRSV